MKSIQFYSFDVKAIVTKNVARNILRKQKKRNVMIENLSCDFGESKQIFKMDSDYPKTFLNYMNQRQVENERYDITSQI